MNENKRKKIQKIHIGPSVDVNDENENENVKKDGNENEVDDKFDVIVVVGVVHNDGVDVLGFDYYHHHHCC